MNNFLRNFILYFSMGKNIIHKWWKYHEEIIFRYLVIKKSLVLNGPLWKFIIYYMIIICSVWFANTKLQAFPFHIVKKWMYNSGLFCCKSCRQNPIFYSFLLKKNFKKNFSSKKIQKSKLTNFRFQLDWKLGFRARDKNCKIEKAGRTWLQVGSSTCLLVVSTIHRCSYLQSEDR